MSHSDYDYHQYMVEKSAKAEENRKAMLDFSRAAYNAEMLKLRRQTKVLETITKTILAIGFISLVICIAVAIS